MIRLGAICVVAIWPKLTCGGSPWREPMARSMLSQLSQAAKAYELDCAAYPPGDGSAGLVRALRASRKPVFGYFEFPAEQPPDGDIPSPIDSLKVFRYRAPG